MRKMTMITLATFILIFAVILIVDRQLDQGILNNLEKQQTSKGRKAEINENKKRKTAVVPKENLHSITIVIDPGHQAEANTEQEPISPGSAKTKAKVSSGTTGVVTKKPEYKLTLEASLRLQEILNKKGYNVILTRTSNQVDISNIERSKLANKKNADLFLRIHADGSENVEVNGFSVLTPGKGDHYRNNIYSNSLLAAKTIITRVGKEISLHQNGLFYRNDLSGFNWSKVPVVLVELGFMTNPEEDKKLSDESYLSELVNLIAEGVEDYLEEKKN